MITQILPQPSMISHFIVDPSPIHLPSVQPDCASSCDYGFDFDADELALLRVYPSDQSTPEVSADEFESTYTWFIS